MNPGRSAVTRRQVKHVPHTEQRFSPLLVKDGARINLRGDLEGNPGRNIGLDKASNDIHGWALSCQNQVYASRPRFLGNPRNQLFDLLANNHHHVSKLINHHHDLRQLLQIRSLCIHRVARPPQWILDRIATGLGRHDLGIESLEVPHAHDRHQLITTLHLANTPAQRISRILHVGDYLGQQMRNALINR